jgi:hypothetical protein
MMNATASHDLAARLTELLGKEQTAMADFLLALADFDRVRAWEPLGYAGLFPFLHQHLRLSKAAAFFRMRAAQLLQKFPEIVEPLRDGRLCLTSIAELGKVLTLENRDAVLPRFFHCSKQEAKLLSAELTPMKSPPQRAVVTAVARSRPLELVPPAPSPEPAGVGLVRPGEPNAPEVVQPALVPEPPRAQVVPMTASQSRVHLTVSRQFVEKLETARLALSHSRPGATKEDVLEAALDLLLAKDAKKKGLVANPRPAAPCAKEPAADYIPAALRREVWKRDRGCCQWATGPRKTCGSKYRPEIDHIKPKGQGGKTVLANLRVLCRTHNLLAARLAYGEEYMQAFRRKPRPRHEQRPSASPRFARANSP